MKLLDLNPRWVANHPKRLGMGLAFNCPHCRERIVIWFKNPIDDKAPFEDTRYWWDRIGEDLETISVKQLIIFEPHWSGNLTQGELIAAQPSLLLP